jgi:flagellar hook assembly protein FlgD
VINAVPDRQVPQALALDLRTVPNPFNPSTEIRFNLPRDGRVEVRIYDLRGRLVWRAEPQEMTAGAQAVAWHGVDRHGGAVNSGLYFYRLVLDGQQLGETGKMTLLK